MSHFLPPSFIPAIYLSLPVSQSLPHGPFKSLFLLPLSSSHLFLVSLVREAEEHCGLVVPPKYLIRIKHIRTILHSIIHARLGDTRTAILHPSPHTPTHPTEEDLGRGRGGGRERHFSSARIGLTLKLPI